MLRTGFSFFFFFINGHGPESQSASLHSTCLISGVTHFNMFDCYKTVLSVLTGETHPVFKSDFDADNTVLTIICRLLCDDFEGILKNANVFSIYLIAIFTWRLFLQRSTDN